MQHGLWTRSHSWRCPSQASRCASDILYWRFVNLQLQSHGCNCTLSEGTKTAHAIIVDSAPFYKKLSLELGGKNPNIIFDDADLSQAVPTSVRSSFANQGEICLCGSRLFVQKGIYDKFLEQFIAQAKQLKVHITRLSLSLLLGALTRTKYIQVGDPKEPSTNMGALVSKEHLEKIQYYVELAKEEGGKIVLGGDRPNLDGELKNGYYHNPTVIVGLPPSCRVQQEEIFGPVVTVTPFESEEEVIEWANCVKYGLSATVWTENLRKAHRVAQELKAGTVWINTWMKVYHKTQNTSVFDLSFRLMVFILTARLACAIWRS